jgi:hypothetical protein
VSSRGVLTTAVSPFPSICSNATDGNVVTTSIYSISREHAGTAAQSSRGSDFFSSSQHPDRLCVSSAHYF